MNRDPQRRKSIFLHPVFMIFVGFPALLFGGIFVRALMEPVREQPRPKLFPTAPVSPRNLTLDQQLSNMEKAADIGRIVESSLRSSVPDLDRHLAEAVVSAFQGYLIIKLKPSFTKLDEDERIALEQKVLARWQEMKYAKDRGWDRRVEVMQYTDTDQTSSYFVIEPR
ncbi:hypothetical protein [Singulisphaera sp. PoT]|uniref:hypothetical protein n=1 Tax=Singulisphaera sp. PoT TaxID=3411797 RepID=UPI003BF5A94D